MTTATAPRRVHPLSPVAHAGQALAPLLAGVVLAGQGIPFVGRIVLVLLALALVAFFGWLSWLRTSFWFDADGDLRVSTGILFRNERRVQLSRLQAVEVQRPFVARLVGLADVRPEVAGGERAKVRIAFLAEADAHALRNELLARSAGIRGDAQEAPVAPERALVRVPPGDLALSMVMNESLIVAILVGGVFVLGALVSGESAGLFGLFLAGGIPSIGLMSGFLTFYDFTVAESPDGLRIRSGLLSTRSQTVPPGRVQAVRIDQPLLWRGKGWVRITVNVAGAGGSDDNDAGAILLPVAPYAVARDLLQRVLPGVNFDAVPVHGVPSTARWRAPLQHRRLAAGSDADVFVARSGWLVRRTVVVPHARAQSVRVTQGPWQRRLRLATVHLDSTPGRITPMAAHRDALDARALAEEQLVLARAARRSFRPEHWMTQPPDRGGAPR